MDLKLLLKRGALLAAANWPTVAIQFVAEATFQMLLAVPVIGAAILVAVLLGANLGELLQGTLRDIFTTIASTLMAEPVAFVAFVAAFAVVLLGGSILMFLVKGGIVDVLVAAHRAAGPIEREPITFETFQSALTFKLPRFGGGCARLFRRYLALGFALMVVYAVSGGAYLAFACVRLSRRVRALCPRLDVHCRDRGRPSGRLDHLVNLLYLLTQVAVAVDDVGPADAFVAVLRFIRAAFRELLGVARGRAGDGCGGHARVCTGLVGRRASSRSCRSSASRSSRCSWRRCLSAASSSSTSA